MPSPIFNQSSSLQVPVLVKGPCTVTLEVSLRSPMVKIDNSVRARGFQTGAGPFGNQISSLVDPRREGMEYQSTGRGDATGPFARRFESGVPAFEFATSLGESATSWLGAV